MTESSRRRFLKAAAGGALTGGALLLPGGTAEAAVRTRHWHRHPHHHWPEPGDGGEPGPVGGNPPGGAATSYSLTVVNNSTSRQDFAVYQRLVDFEVRNGFPLAWLTASAFPGSMVRFTWTTDYSFVWAETGRLAPGVLFKAAQVRPANPDDRFARQALFTYQRGEFTFQDDPRGFTPRPGSIGIREDSGIPFGRVSVGIGMSGAGTFAVQAQPSENLDFPLRPEYWVTAGTYETGQALDVFGIGRNARLDFGPGTSLRATLNPNNTWTVTPD